MKLRTIILIVFCWFSNVIYSQNNQQQKELYLPEKIWKIPERNNFQDASSEYSFNRMIESENIAMFWHKEYGANPMDNTDETRRFNPKKAILECERFYNFYVDSLKLVQKGKSLTDKYKLLIFVIGGEEGTAFGGGSEDVGVLWTPAVRINKSPYGALAHEIGHSFQYLSRRDSKSGPNGPVMEMSAQYMLWQVYPDWLTFENYHLKGFLEGTHYAFLHPKNMYHSPFVLEYWSYKRGIDFWGELSRNSQEGEDVVETYKKLYKLNQDEFNDEMFDASRRFITWDLPRIDSLAGPYRNMHKTKLTETGDGWYKVDSTNCPQNYGYNAIKLKVPKYGQTIRLDFKGIVRSKEYNNSNAEFAGWRYGFVAYLNNGNRVYSKIYKDPQGRVKFKIPENTEYLWFTVTGAPRKHNSLVLKRGIEPLVEQWPYKFRLSGTFAGN